jgi:SEC-C motif-containing protein
VRLPPDAQALMRSRYAAFALKQTDHLYRTLHPSHPDRARPKDDVMRALKKTCNRFTYPQLDILEVVEPNAAGEAFVTFHATLLDQGRDVGFTERSRFLRDGNAWTYVDGVMPTQGGRT